MIYLCRDERRREAVRALEALGFNGIDFLDVANAHTLNVHFVNPLKAGTLDKEDVFIDGGERIRDVAVVDVQIVGEQVLAVKVNKPGDSTTYTLRLQTHRRLRLDPQLSSIDFTFKLDARNDFDVSAGIDYLADVDASLAPIIDYLCKDYTGFRQLMLDRLSTLIPQRHEQSEADVGVMLVEVLAYVADHLSYQQDVIATESYLSTARRRISVRRHARLLDYFINEGCNARVWAQIRVDEDIAHGSAPIRPDNAAVAANFAQTGRKESKAALPKGTKLLTKIPGQELVSVDSEWADLQALNGQAEMFETMHTVRGLFAAHNEMLFYTWGANECWLPQGATRATLREHFPHLQPGDVLIFEEVLGPATGRPQDADPTHRHAVRLTKVRRGEDPLGAWFSSHERRKNGERTQKLKEPEPDHSTPITEIEWHDEDALPFPLCISITVENEDGSFSSRDVSIALGNIVLADHGCTVEEPHFASVPGDTSLVGQFPGGNGSVVQHFQFDRLSPALVRFYPAVHLSPLTYAVPYDVSDQTQPASAVMQYTSHDAAPFIKLASRVKGDTHDRHFTWHARRDLLECSSFDLHFVVEIDDNGQAYLRFGDDQHGMRPAPGTVFDATYRVGNGVRGKIGLETLYHIASAKGEPPIDSGIAKVDNPLSALGGVDPQSIDDVRQNVSWSFNTQERGVTPDDYKTLAEAAPGVERACAVMRWTGSWHTVLLAAERAVGLPVDDEFLRTLRRYMEPFRTVGTDLQVVAPIYVSLEIDMIVYVAPTYLRNSVRALLLEVFSDHQWPDGRRGIFYPDNYTFGRAVYLSELFAAAYAVAGVELVTISRFQRQGIPGPGLDQGVLAMEWLEIARLENDPNYPEHGVFRLTMEGGK
jgi:Baseplate J-like protein